MEGSAGLIAGRSRQAGCRKRVRRSTWGFLSGHTPWGTKPVRTPWPLTSLWASRSLQTLTCSPVKFWGRLSVFIPQRLYPHPSLKALKPKWGFRKTKRAWGSTFLWLPQSARVGNYRGRLKMTLGRASDQLPQGEGHYDRRGI